MAVHPSTRRQRVWVAYMLIWQLECKLHYFALYLSMFLGFDVFRCVRCFHDLSIQHDTTTIDVLAEVGSETDRRREAARAQPLFLGGFLWKWLQLWSCQWTGHLLHFWTIFKRNVTISLRRSKTCFPVCNGVYKNAQEIPLYNSHMQSQSIIFCMAFKLVLLGCL